MIIMHSHSMFLQAAEERHQTELRQRDEENVVSYYIILHIWHPYLDNMHTCTFKLDGLF